MSLAQAIYVVINPVLDYKALSIYPQVTYRLPFAFKLSLNNL